MNREAYTIQLDKYTYPAQFKDVPLLVPYVKRINIAGSTAQYRMMHMKLLNGTYVTIHNESKTTEFEYADINPQPIDSEDQDSIVYLRKPVAASTDNNLNVRRIDL
jgi:hypothetical protein